MKLPRLNISRKSGEEALYTTNGSLDGGILDFWQWSTSDLLSNVVRGRFAEYIVGQAIGVVDGTREEWDPYDLVSNKGQRIEIKASAYLQSWHQDAYSTISFDIAPKILWDPDTNKFEGKSMRQSDVYVFCLLHHKDKNTVDPLNLDQWTFYVMRTKVLDEMLPHQKRLSLKKLLKLEPEVCSYEQLKRVLE